MEREGWTGLRTDGQSISDNRKDIEDEDDASVGSTAEVEELRGFTCCKTASMRTCRQIYGEACEIMYGADYFEISIRGSGTVTTVYFLDQCLDIEEFRSGQTGCFDALLYIKLLHINVYTDCSSEDVCAVRDRLFAL